MEYWKRRDRLELETILDELRNLQGGDAWPKRTLRDLNRFLKASMKSGALAWEGQNPNGGGPYLGSSIEYAHLRKFAEGIQDPVILRFCEVWVEGSPVWDAVKKLSSPPVPAEPKIDGASSPKSTEAAKPNAYSTKKRSQDQADILRRTNDYERIHASARKLCNEKGKLFEYAVIAEELAKSFDYSSDTIRQILNGTYAPAIARGLKRFER